MLVVRGLTKHFGGVIAVEDFSFTLPPEEILGLIGPNGAGKSTVFNLLTGLYRPDRGEILFHHQNIIGLPVHRYARLGIGRTFQATRLFSAFTVAENIQVACEVFQSKVSADRIRENLHWVKLESKADQPIERLSSAEQRRLMIALAMCAHPRVLLLDEPTAGMIADEVEETLEMVRQIRRNGTAVLFIEHNMRAVMNLCDRVLVINSGRLIAEGTPAQIRRNPEVIEAYLGKGEAEGDIP